MAMCELLLALHVVHQGLPLAGAAHTVSRSVSRRVVHVGAIQRCGAEKRAFFLGAQGLYC